MGIVKRRKCLYMDAMIEINLINVDYFLIFFRKFAIIFNSHFATSLWINQNSQQLE